MERLDELASLDPGPLAQVLASHRPEQRELEPGQWLSLVELLSMRLSRDVDDPHVAPWPTCAEAFEYVLACATASGAIDHHEALVRRLNFSLVLLRKVPPNPRVDLLNPSYLIGLVLRNLPMSVEEAKALSSDWRSLELSRVRSLRAIKNLLSPVLAISELVPEGELDARLSQWRQVFPSLP